MSERHLVLVRHAKSDYPAGTADHDRPLNERGRRDAPVLGRWLDHHVDPAGAARVAVSSAERTRQTWAALAESLGDAWTGVPVITDERIYEASPKALRDVILDQGPVETVVLVGHSPGLPQLVAELGRPSAMRSEALEKFPTSAIAVLSTELPWAEALSGVGTFDVSSFAIPRG
jgi:phosphohistidine phosphatase